jgi:ferredoxin-NADP reductase/MOSC domain-containing protein YiiM
VGSTLISVNVGLPRDVRWGERTVHTGIWKRPVDGPQMVRRLNLDGDGQGDLAGHGGPHRAVLVYQQHAYRHWAKTLNRDDLTPEIFGENFNVDGLPDDEMCIGDRYRIGEALFEVTQPRVTCYRLGLRLNEPQMAALLVAQSLPGFYMRVLKEGHVQTGDEIIKVADGPEGFSVSDMDRLLYLPDPAPADLQRALRIPALSPGWQSSLQAMCDQPEPGGGHLGPGGATAAPPPAWAGFRTMTVAQTTRETPQVMSLWLAASDGEPLPDWLPGQAIGVRLPPQNGESAVIRNYSLSDRPGDTMFRISVKREPHGVASTYLHSRIHPGDPIEIAAPRGTFILTPGDNPVVLASAGVGATPVLGMLYWLAERERHREIWWLHGTRNRSEHAFADEVRDLLAKLPSSRSYVFFSRPSESDIVGRDYTNAGHITAKALAELGLPASADAYLCGPATFMTDVATQLAGIGVDPRRIYSEAFGAGPASEPGVVGAGIQGPPHQPQGPPGTGPEVTFARSGLTTVWDDRFASLLELAEGCGVPTRWACRTGVCHTCETAMLSGSVRYHPEPLAPPAVGSVLICCARPTDRTVIDL